MRLTITPLARADVKENAAYLENQREGLGTRFLQAVEDTYDTLQNHPEIAGRIETSTIGLSEIRAWPVKGFPNHIVFYQIEEEFLRVIRKLHGSREIETHLSQPDL